LQQDRSSSDESLEDILRRREQEIVARSSAREAEEKARQEAQKKALARIVFTPEARQRLSNLKLVKPELATQVEEYLIILAQQGKIAIPVDDETLKSVLEKLQPKRETKIWRL
jgi:programmed cell death protein 5